MQMKISAQKGNTYYHTVGSLESVLSFLLIPINIHVFKRPYAHNNYDELYRQQHNTKFYKNYSIIVWPS